MRGVNPTKLLILAILGFCAVVLGSAVLTLQLYVTQEKQRLGIWGGTVKVNGGGGGGNSATTTSRTNDNLQGNGRAGPSKTSSSPLSQHTKASFATSTRSSVPHTIRDVRLQQAPNHPPPQGLNPQTSSQRGYWHQAAAILQGWDALLQPPVGEDDDGSHVPVPGMKVTLENDDASLVMPINNKKNIPYARWALQQAAEAGHPSAQHYVANAHASGIWPMNDHFNNATANHLHVFDEWSPTTAHGDHPHQLTKAFALWHMAAMGGNIESAMALAYRISELGFHDSNSNDGSSTSENTLDPEQASCMESLPYLEAAAHGIVDQLEASPNSRAKVLPPMDKHILAQVHMHGGTSSQLDWNNKPYESKEAIQFYHLKATTTPWSARLYASSSSKDKDGENVANDDEAQPAIDVHAAFTLAHLYHYGFRGVPQNLTQSLLYYEIAARYGHWESAGEAGTFYLWGMGTPQNVYKAYEYFDRGSPYGLEGCRRKHEQSLLQKHHEDSTTNPIADVHECDAISLNGMGVLHVLGVPGELDVDLRLAEKYFALAKEMGNADAMYHLSMMWLGWKTHFKRVDDLFDNGMSSVDHTDAFPGGAASKNDNTGGGDDASVATATANTKKKTATFALHYSPRTHQVHKGPIQSEIQDAIKLLTLAANKGHLQAKHRLAMIYSEGIPIQTAALKYDAVKPSCSKARVLYQWITENASLQRSKRLRTAYKAYTEGQLEVSLRNYLAAGETGSNVGQVNAAFLLERGTCLGLSPSDCAKASVRLWKAASARGSTEACLRVGDFYYYGRLRASTLPVGPFGWVQYILYPEEYLPELLRTWTSQLWNILKPYIPDDYSSILNDWVTDIKSPPTAEEFQHQQEVVESDLSMAAHYYTEAAEKHHSPRANFNLGFIYEWGLGVKQDFPLAKRHYDLAASVNHAREAELAVQIALWSMWTHEYVVKIYMSWKDWRNKQATRSSSFSSSPSSSGSTVWSPKASSAAGGGQPVPGNADRLMGKTAQDVVLSHLFNWSSLLIVVLICMLMQLQRVRENRRRR